MSTRTYELTVPVRKGERGMGIVVNPENCVIELPSGVDDAGGGGGDSCGGARGAAEPKGSRGGGARASEQGLGGRAQVRLSVREF